MIKLLKCLWIKLFLAPVDETPFCTFISALKCLVLIVLLEANLEANKGGLPVHLPQSY
jgi:hypothetical protein